MALSDILFQGLWSALINHRRVRVTVHRAYFVKHPHDWAYFINVTNLSRDREIEITHVWLATTPEAHAVSSDRPLPKRLKPDETWETWIPESRVPATWRGDRAFRVGRVRLSTGRIVHSKPNKNVPSFGETPGGQTKNRPHDQF